MERCPLTRRFVLVLVLESGHAERWSVGVLEYCAKSELHPATAGLKMLTTASQARQRSMRASPTPLSTLGPGRLRQHDRRVTGRQ
jgi:hypothetical protein